MIRRSSDTGMDEAPLLKRPADCSAEELLAFERVVRETFAGSDDGLPDRIRSARALAFRYAADGALAAIAALKEPGDDYRREVFRKAGVSADPEDFGVELGWVWVAPEHRGRRIGEHLCRRLLAQPALPRAFATTRPDNAAMIRELHALCFERHGEPYPHVRRDETLVLFLGPSASTT